MVLVELAGLSLVTLMCCGVSCCLSIACLGCGLYHCFSYKEQKALRNIFKEAEKALGRENVDRERKAHSVLQCLFFPCYFHYAMMSGIKMYNNAKNMGITAKEGGGDIGKKDGAPTKPKPTAATAPSTVAGETREVERDLEAQLPQDVALSISGVECAPADIPVVVSTEGLVGFTIPVVESGTVVQSEGESPQSFGGWTGASSDMATDEMNSLPRGVQESPRALMDTNGVVDLTTDDEMSIVTDGEVSLVEDGPVSPPVRTAKRGLLFSSTEGAGVYPSPVKPSWGAATTGKDGRGRVGESVDMVSLGRSFDGNEVTAFLSNPTPVQPAA